jgi:penicillin-binding protein 2B
MAVTKKIKLRTLLLGMMLSLLFCGLIFRTYHLQIVEASTLRAMAERSWISNKELIPKRGTIYDRNGNILAQDGPAYTVAVNPELIAKVGTADEVVKILSSALEMNTPEGMQKLLDAVTAKNKEGKYLVQKEIRNEGWKIDSALKDKIVERFGGEKQMNRMGVYMIEEQKRYYPSNELAAHVLGYMDKDGNPRSGVEYRYHELLKGTPGSIHYIKDLLGYELPDGEVGFEPAVDGKSIRLTIDQNIQSYIEQALLAAYEKYEPKSMSAIAVNPKTMEILGMANLPVFNPNRYWDFASQADFYNHAVLSLYEPGSTFKIVTLAAAEEEGLFHPDDTFQSGSISFPEWGSKRIHDHNRTGWGEITYLEGLKRSSNVAFVKLGYEKLGKEKLSEYIHAFGFGQPTGIDLPGEGVGDVDFRYPIEVANATFGQGVTVTVLQQIAAVSAIANGGTLMKPYLLKEVIDPETGEVIERTEPQAVRRVVSEETARKVAEYLEQVVADREIGTGRDAYIEGYRVAGKTGTAQVVENGTYASDKWLVSFVGFAPVENPRIALIVIADEPKVDDYRMAGRVLPPVFKEIMEKSLHYLGVTANFPTDAAVANGTRPAETPDFVGRTPDEARNLAARSGFELEVYGNGERVVRQFPAPGTDAGTGQRMYALTEPADDIGFPDLTGMSLRDALDLCALWGALCTAEGEGYVTEQVRSRQENGLHVTLRLKPRREQTDAGAETREESLGELPADDGPSEGSAGAETPEASL